ncbi:MULTISPECIES: hypothetical protein [unclassified Mesorhizobium]|nr:MULTISPECIES: hypothetical protein [unclassified Mesorhizobium]
MTIVCTQDGNWLAFVTGLGTVSGASRDEVVREIDRRRSARTA